MDDLLHEPSQKLEISIDLLLNYDRLESTTDDEVTFINDPTSSLL